LTHTFIDEYADGAFQNIKWLDEGLAQYEAWKFLSMNSSHREDADSFKTNALNVFSQLKSNNKVYPLNKLSTQEQWNKEVESGNSTYIYPQTYLLVTYLASNYGIEPVKLLLNRVKNGASAPEAIKSVLKKTEAEIVDELKNASPTELFKQTETSQPSPSISPTPSGTPAPTVTTPIVTPTVTPTTQTPTSHTNDCPTSRSRYQYDSISWDSHRCHSNR